MYMKVYRLRIHRGTGGLRLVALTLLLGGLTLPLGHAATSAASGKRLNALTTVAPLTNIVRNVGGPYIDLHGLIPGGTDSHTFEPIPSDIRYIAEADVIILNGLHLEVPTEKLALANKK